MLRDSLTAQPFIYTATYNSDTPAFHQQLMKTFLNHIQGRIIHFKMPKWIHSNEFQSFKIID